MTVTAPSELRGRRSWRPATPGFWSRYWTTLRPYLFFVSGSAGLVGLAASPGPGPVAMAGSVAVFLLAYGLGQALTDVDQTDTDALSAPYRPLVRGEIRADDVRAVSLAGLAGCSAWLLILNPWTLVPCAFMVAALLTYTPMKRRWWGGPAWNSAIVALLPLTGWLAGGGHPAALGATPRVPLAMLSAFGTYAAFVLLGYLKDVEADRATGYETVAVRFGRRAAVGSSALHASVGAAASSALVGGAAVGSWLVLWGLGLGVLGAAHVRAWGVTRDADAHPAVSAAVLGFTLLHLGESAALRPELLPLASLLAAGAVLLLLRRPFRRQV